VGIVVTGITFVYLFFYTSVLTDFLYKIYPGWNGDLSTLSGLTANTSNISLSDAAPILESFLLVLVVLWIFSIIAAFFARRSLKALSAKASVGLFSTAALLLLIGGFLAIAFIGFILMWIALLLIAIAFFQIKPQPEQPVATASPSPSTPTPV
jgi:asparagine N-glycosylation enzyme membrane subunit Stt3